LDNSGNLAAEYSYDAWGRMRNPANWQVYAQGSQPAMLHGERGYTGHEQLNGFGLINMNARLYDPLLARFLAPDPFVGSGLTNDFNRYIYARNNPMMYTDPTGKSFSSWWKKNIAIPFMQELHHVFGNGFTLSFGTDTQFLSTSAVIAPNGSNGMPYGPGFGVQTNDWKTFSPVYANCQGGFMNTQSVNYESNLQKTVVQVENSARKEYYGQLSNAISAIDYGASIAGKVGYNATLGIWKDLSKVRYYSSGWSGSNQYVWKTFKVTDVAAGIIYGANVAINSYEYKGGQSGLETNLNIGVNTTSLIVGGTSGIGISVGYEYLKFMWNNILNYGESVHQLFYEKYQNYWKGTEFDPEK